MASGKNDEMTVGQQIVNASTQICSSTAKIILSETAAPQKGLVYVNNHVKQLMAEQALQRHQLEKHHKILDASLSDLKHTVVDVREIAGLNSDFSDKMLADLNRLLLDVSQI